MYLIQWEIQLSIQLIYSLALPIHSCHAVLPIMTKNWLSNINDKLKELYYVDFKKTVDMTNHEIMIKSCKLAQKKICSITSLKQTGISMHDFIIILWLMFQNVLFLVLYSLPFISVIYHSIFSTLFSLH